MASKAKVSSASSAKAVAARATSRHDLSANNIIAGVIVISILVVIVCGYIGKGLVDSLVLNGKMVAGKLEAKNDLDTKLENIPVLIDNYKALGPTQKLIEHSLPTDPDFPQIISIMQGVSTAPGVQLKSVTPNDVDAAPAAAGATDTAAGPQPYTFSATITGNYPQVVTFFKSLETSSRPMRVTQSQFSGEAGTLNVDVSMQTWYQGKTSVDDKMEAIQ